MSCTPTRYCEQHGASLPCHVCSAGVNDIGDFYGVEPQPVPSAEPEMPEGWEFVPGEFGGTFLNEGLCKVMSMGRIRQLLATQGMTIVKASDALPAPFTARMLRQGWKLVPPDADVPSAEERKVLEACAALRISKMGLDGYPYVQTDAKAEQLAQAELARRAAKGKP